MPTAMPDHEATRYYRDLVGEEFTGTWVGCYDHGEPRSQLWLKVAISDESEKLAEGLQVITETFENRIWKGFDEGVLYIKSVEPVAEARYRIKGCKHFDFPAGWRDSEKHEDGCGYYFILEVLRTLTRTPEVQEQEQDSQ